MECNKSKQSQLSAIVYGPGTRTLKISIPDAAIHLKFLYIFTDYLNSSKFKRLASTTRLNEGSKIKKLFDFIIEEFTNLINIPINIFEKFAKWLDQNTGYCGNSIASTVVITIKPIKTLIETNKFTSKDYWQDYFHEIYLNIPTFNRSPAKPNPSLVNLYPDCKYDNKQMITSLRLVCCYLLNLYSDHRKVLLKHPEIMNMLSKLKNYSTNETPMIYGQTNKPNKTHKNINEINKKSYATLLKCILEIDNPILIERIFQSFNKPKHINYKIDEIKKWLELWFHDESRSNLKTYIEIEGVAYQPKIINSICYAYLLRPSDFVVFLIQCIFASERIQISGLMKLSLNNILINLTFPPKTDP